MSDINQVRVKSAIQNAVSNGTSGNHFEVPVPNKEYTVKNRFKHTRQLTHPSIISQTSQSPQQVLSQQPRTQFPTMQQTQSSQPLNQSIAAQNQFLPTANRSLSTSQMACQLPNMAEQNQLLLQQHPQLATAQQSQLLTQQQNASFLQQQQQLLKQQHTVSQAKQIYENSVRQNAKTNATPSSVYRSPQIAQIPVTVTNPTNSGYPQISVPTALYNGSQPATLNLPNGTKIPCPSCKKSTIPQIVNNCFKCSECFQRFIPVHIPSSTSQAAAFYGNSSATQSAKKRLAEKSASKSKKQKQITTETIDLVSSDEEATPAATANNRIEDRMKLQGGALPTKAASESTNTPTINTIVQLPNEYKFECNKAMFGELYGTSTSPTNVMKQRIYLSLECSIIRDNAQSSEKYTLSVGKSDIKQVLVYFGRSPSFVAIETAVRFSEVACKRIGSNVLDPTSEQPTKRYILLALKHAFKNDKDASRELAQFITCVQPWCNISLLTHLEAVTLISRLKLNVDQKEILYSSLPPKTLLSFPIPSAGKTGGGIPITEEDVACLAEGVYLNDVIIDFYLRYIFDRKLTPEQRNKTYIFNSYFYKRLTQKRSPKPTPAEIHAQVKKWTRNVDIFEKDFIIIPINEHSHWYLAIICFPNIVNASYQADDNEEDEETEEDSQKEESMEISVTHMDVGKTAESSATIASASIESSTSTPPVATTPQSTSSPSQSSPSIPAPASTPSLVSYDYSSSEDSNPAPDKPPVPTEEESSALLNQPKPPTPEEEGSETQEAVPAEPKTDSSVTLAANSVVRYKQANEKTEVYQRPCILIFDSLVGSGHSSVFTNLRNYLSAEWTSRKSAKIAKTFDKKTMKGSYPKIPRQNNDCDCGIFVLQYVESFFESPTVNFRIPLHLENWFTLECASRKREKIKQLIQQLEVEYNNSVVPS